MLESEFTNDCWQVAPAVAGMLYENNPTMR
jgi:hypothetical protein